MVAFKHKDTHFLLYGYAYKSGYEGHVFTHLIVELSEKVF